MLARHYGEAFFYFTAQVMGFCILAGTGMVFAGNYLELAHKSGWLKYSSLIMMIPPLIGLKGNIEMTFSSRISAIANTDGIGFGVSHLIASNFILSFVLAVTGGAIVAACSVLLQSPAFQFDEAFVSFSVAIISSSLAVIFIGFCMLIVIHLCVKFSVNPDNVAAPLAAALGDLFMLLIMMLVIWITESFFGSPLPAYFGMLCCVFFAYGPALSYLRESTSESCLAADYITLTHSLAPLLSAVLLSSASGWILASYVDHLPSLPRLQPPINGVGGNLASILISRITTRLSIAPKPTIMDDIVDRINAATQLSYFDIISEEKRSFAESSFTHSEGGEDEGSERSRPLDSPKATELAVALAISDSTTSAWRLLALCLPLHSLLLIINYVASSLFHESLGPNAFSFPVILAYLAAGFLQAFVLLLFARRLVLQRWLSLARQQQQVISSTNASAGGLAALDLTGIAITTGLGDFLGTAFLAIFLYLAEGP